MERAAEKDLIIMCYQPHNGDRHGSRPFMAGFHMSDRQKALTLKLARVWRGVWSCAAKVEVPHLDVGAGESSPGGTANHSSSQFRLDQNLQLSVTLRLLVLMDLKTCMHSSTDR